MLRLAFAVAAVSATLSIGGFIDFLAVGYAVVGRQAPSSADRRSPFKCLPCRHQPELTGANHDNTYFQISSSCQTPASATGLGTRRDDLRLAAVAAAIAFQSPAYSTPPDVGTAAEAAAALAAIKGNDSAAKIAELEKGFWICDYIGTTRGIEGPHGVACGTNFEELKQTKFGGDFDELVQWWRVNKAAQHKALEFAGSAQY